MAPVERVPGHSDGVTRARPVVLAVLSMEVGLLAVTGVVLYFIYRPSPSEAWIQMTGVDRRMGLPEWTRLLHRWIAILTLPTALVACMVSSLRPLIRGRRQGPAAAAGVLVASLGAMATGVLLPWDQLALWAVTRGEIYVGYRPLLDGDVRFVLSDRGEEAPSTVITWLVIHALVGVAASALVAVAWRLSPGRRADSEAVRRHGALAEPGGSSPRPRRWERRGSHRGLPD